MRASALATGQGCRLANFHAFANRSPRTLGLCHFGPQTGCHCQMIDDQAIDRILSAVGEKFVPAGLDKSALRAAIEKALVTQKFIEKHRPGTRTRKISKQLSCICKASDKLLSLLTAENDATGMVTQHLPEAAFNIRLL